MKTLESSGGAIGVPSLDRDRGGDATALSGREEELRRLAEALAAARSGQPGVALIDGPPGIGKTALIRRFADGLDDVTFVWASGDASERTVPFGLADQLVRRARPATASPLVAVDAAQHTAVGLTILEALGELQRSGPVVLVVDDAQWADPGSLRALLFAIRRLVADTVLVVLTVRAEDLHVLPDGLARIADAPHCARLTLGRLGFDDVRAMARGRGLPLSARALRQVHELSDGVPLHVCALLAEWAATGDFERITTPSSYAALIAGRLARCSDRARGLIEAAAVLGRHASIEDVARVAGVDAPLEGLEEAASHDFIRVAKRSVEFVHPLIRSAVHDALGPARLAELHTVAATLATDPGAALLHRAYAAVGPDARLADDLEAAARRAGADGNWLRAADFLSEAAGLSPTSADRERRIVDSVSALCEAGDLVAARAMLAKVREFGMSAEREFILGRVALSQLEVQAAERHLELAWAMCPAENAQLRTGIASELASSAYFRVDARGHLDWARQAMELAPGPVTARTVAIATALNGRPDKALALVDGALSSSAPGAEDVIPPKTARGRLRLINDDLAGARRDLTDVRSAAMRGASRSAAMALGRLSVVEYLAGHWDLALGYAEQGLAACVDRTDLAQISAVRAPAVIVLAGRGAWPDADHHLQAMVLESHGVALPGVYTAYAGAVLAAAKGDADGVIRALAPVLALVHRDAVDEPGVWPWQNLHADALLDLGRLGDADRFLAPHEALARERGRRSMIGRLARSRARLEAAQENDDHAHDAFLQSAEALSAISMPYELALTELAHGQFLRRRRRRRAAVELLANARDRLAAVGAEPALRRCERELQATGLAPKRPAAKGLRRLTAQELTVARLVVAGMTNREVAGELMVSTKTVEVHLTSVYAKLELPSRSELRARARRGELELLHQQTA